MKPSFEKFLKKNVPHHFLELLLGLSKGLTHRPRPQNRKIAGILQTRDYSDSCSVFDTMSGLCDATIVLDHNSQKKFPFGDKCTEYLTLTNKNKWNYPANATLLMYRAYVHGCEWVLHLDDDIILSHDLQTRESLNRLIEKMERNRIDVLHLRQRDLWDSAEKYRCDGIWANKSFAILRRNWFFYKKISLREAALRLHTPTFPENLIAKLFVEENSSAYHLGCFSRKDREKRVEKYRREDPTNTFQKDYVYMLDENNLETRMVPEADLQVLRNKLRLRA